MRPEAEDTEAPVSAERDDESQDFELTGCQTAAERTEANRIRAERANDVLELSSDDDKPAPKKRKSSKIDSDSDNDFEADWQSLRSLHEAIRAAALACGRTEVGAIDLLLAADALWQRPETRAPLVEWLIDHAVPAAAATMRLLLAALRGQGHRERAHEARAAVLRRGRRGLRRAGG